MKMKMDHIDMTEIDLPLDMDTYSKYISIMMLVWIKQQLSNIWSSIHEKVKQLWAWVEKSVPYKKSVYYLCLFLCLLAFVKSKFRSLQSIMSVVIVTTYKARVKIVKIPESSILMKTRGHRFCKFQNTQKDPRIRIF